MNQDNSKSVSRYYLHFDKYLSDLASEKYDDALKHLDYAISECPVREAIGYLSACRASLVRDMTPFGGSLAKALKGLFRR